jgi:hypothetical protein
MANNTSNALAVRHQNKQEFFTYTISKLDDYVGELVKNEISQANDGLVENLVYGRIPMISLKVISCMVTYCRKLTLTRYWIDKR